MKIFIGYDSREDIAYQVAAFSLRKFNDRLDIAPLKLGELRAGGLYWREDDKKASTEFTLTRFLVPFLSHYEGVSLFVDCDVLCLENIENILADIDIQSADVWCVQHDYTPSTLMKMDGRPQYSYPRKNWSSVMLFNNSNCRVLTPELVNSQSPAYLHRMSWTQKIGELDPRWNCLAGYYDLSNPALIHYTDGGPWFSGYEKCPYSDYWHSAHKEMIASS